MYGAQKHKVAKMLDISPERGQAVIDAYWDGNPGLKQAKEKLEDYWMRTGKKYIMGIDGRKIYTRSKHSLLNALFQSTGAILMDYSGALCSDIGRSERLVFHRWGYYHK